MSNQRQILLVSGRVQGVYYRASAAEKANQLGVTGYAQNLSDGRVKIVSEGSPELLSSLMEWCNHGPAGARVDEVIATGDSATGEFSGFIVR